MTIPARLVGLHRLFAGLMGAATQSTWVADDAEGIVSVASWQRPDRSPTPELIAYAEAELPGLLGDAAERLDSLEELTAGDHPAGPHWVLASVGTLPQHRGRGHASALVSAGLREVDRAGLAAWLETSSESNVRFYCTHGFVTTSQHEDVAGATLWTMTRSAGGPRQPFGCITRRLPLQGLVVPSFASPSQ